MKEEKNLKNINDNYIIQESYFDENFNKTTKENAKCIVTTKFDKNGNFIDEIYDYGSYSISNNGGIRKIYKKTNRGADYIEMHFFDKNGKYEREETCDYIMLRECKNDGTLVYEEKLVRTVEASQS